MAYRTSGKNFINLKELFGAIQQSGVSREVFFQEAIEVYGELCSANSGQAALVGNVYPVIVDYARNLADMIVAGNYDYKNSDITAKHFPVKGDGKQEVAVEFLYLACIASTEYVLAEMERRGLRPATLPELLAFGEKYPDLQRQFPIVALGSSWVRPDGYRLVACLWDDDGGRDLYLSWYADDWYDNFRFLAVRK